jgi:hypothetical protein
MGVGSAQTLSELQHQKLFFVTRNNAMSTDQNLIPGPHARTSKRISQARQRRTLRRILQDLHTRISEERPKRAVTQSQAPLIQCISKIFMQGPLTTYH